GPAAGPAHIAWHHHSFYPWRPDAVPSRDHYRFDAHTDRAEGLILPAIQREYVWKPRQVVALFDSIMRGYPIGGFLSWKVEPATAQEFRFYDFLSSFNELDQRHNPE